MVEIDEEPIAEEAGGWMNLPEELPEEAVKSLKQLARCAFGIAAPPSPLLLGRAAPLAAEASAAALLLRRSFPCLGEP